MNIFILDKDPKKIAEYHNNKHVVRMIYEGVVMLGFAHQYSRNDDIKNPSIGYKSPRHYNHPCSVWVRQDLNNYMFLYEIIENLNTEWNNRFHDNFRIHKSLELARNFNKKELKLPNENLTTFAMATMWIPRIKNDPVSVYREYYVQCKQHLADWKDKKKDIQKKPYWFLKFDKLNKNKFEFINKYVDENYTKKDFYDYWRYNINKNYKDITLNEFYRL